LFIYGAGGADGKTDAFELYPWDNQFDFTYGTSEIIKERITANNNYTIIQNKSKYSIEDKSAGTTVTGENSVNNFTSPLTLTLFALNRTNGRRISTGYKLYYTKIWNNESIVRDYIPVQRKSDGAIGLYDRVSGTFFGNSGTGSFVGR